MKGPASPHRRSAPDTRSSQGFLDCRQAATIPPLPGSVWAVPCCASLAAPCPERRPDVTPTYKNSEDELRLT
ncbi:hypothetical protein E2C01_074741 [Portunus trituberculatus]|uniref:Uncharacterized protein n=1 Tax=Portunus trituberculatus TaxID=210409 RepID=A0A5B7I8T6_PORTR|nr:hypothetical protein [Portunus trituberculatus]